MFGRNLRIGCFNFFNICTYRTELNAAPLLKNSTKQVLSLSRKALAVNLPAQSLRSEFLLPYPLYSPDVAPFDFHFWSTEEWTLSTRFADDDDELKHDMREKVRRFSKEFYKTVILRLSGKSVLIMKDTLEKNNLNFVKDVPVL
jgi:hypothetical protein